MIRKKLKLNKVSSLKSLLLYWVAGSGLALVVVYSTLVEYNFRFGVKLVLEGNLEWYAQEFETSYYQDKTTPPPKNLGLNSYRSLSELPKPLFNLVKDIELENRNFEVFLEHKMSTVQEAAAFRDKEICDTRVCDVLFFYPYQLSNGEWLYMVQGLAGSEKLYKDNDKIEYMFIALTIIILLSIGGLAWLLVRKVSSPVEELAIWAKELPEQDTPTTPDFKYKELNQVADQLMEALREIRASVDKEHQFLQQASHELRTPLAIASGNIDILNLIGQHNPRTEQERDALGRLSNAINDMTQLTETILWLNRDLESLPELKRINLKQLTESIVEDNQYLLTGKQVNVEVIGDSCEFQSSQILCSILLSNLIRNAFQHTFEGKVTIAIDQKKLQVKNENVSQTKDTGAEVYGFGLGLVLVEQIATRMNWEYQCFELDKGWVSTVGFDKI